MTTLSVTGNPALTALNCAENQLTALDITGLSRPRWTLPETAAPLCRSRACRGYTYDLTQLPELDTSRVTGWENAESRIPLRTPCILQPENPRCSMATSWMLRRLSR
ncbi:MAG: hypothetical protein ACLUOF_03215 [Ruminococcus sp.]